MFSIVHIMGIQNIRVSTLGWMFRKCFPEGFPGPYSGSSFRKCAYHFVRTQMEPEDTPYPFKHISLFRNISKWYKLLYIDVSVILINVLYASMCTIVISTSLIIVIFSILTCLATFHDTLELFWYFRRAIRKLPEELQYVCSSVNTNANLKREEGLWEYCLYLKQSYQC